MDTRSIVEALGIDVVVIPASCDPNRVDDLYGPEIDCSPDNAAELRWVAGKPTVCCHRHYCRRDEGPADSILHEALHAVVGPDSIKNEEVLMGYQAVLIACCTVPEEHALLRGAFASYGFSWRHPRTKVRETNVGFDDVVFESRAWRMIRRRVVEAGLLVRRRGAYEAVFGLGPHPAWNAWAKSNRRFLARSRA